MESKGFPWTTRRVFCRWDLINSLEFNWDGSTGSFVILSDGRRSLLLPSTPSNCVAVLGVRKYDRKPDFPDEVRLQGTFLSYAAVYE